MMPCGESVARPGEEARCLPRDEVLMESFEA